MEKEINEGDTKHLAAPGQSHSLQIYPNKNGKKPSHMVMVSFVQQAQLAWAESP